MGGINVEYDQLGASFKWPWENATIQNQLVNRRGCNITMTKSCLCYSYWSNYSVVFLCISVLERMPAHVDLLDMNSSKTALPVFFPPTFGSSSLSPLLSSRVHPRSANQTGENELKSSLVIKCCGCLEQVHESRPKRNSADFKYKHLWSAVEPSNPLLPQAIKRTAVCELRKRAFGLLFQSHFQWIIGKVVWRLQSWILN